MVFCRYELGWSVDSFSSSLAFGPFTTRVRTASWAILRKPLREGADSWMQHTCSHELACGCTGIRLISEATTGLLTPAQLSRWENRKRPLSPNECSFRLAGTFTLGHSVSISKGRR